MENTNPNPSSEQNESSSISDFTNEVKNFYTGKFPALLGKFFKDPLSGLRDIFEKSSEQNYTNSLILYGSVFIIYIVGLFLLDSRSGFITILKSSLVPVIFMFFLTLVSFGIKSISGKPNFKNELLTGALCGIPLTIFLLYLIVMKIFTGDSFLNSNWMAAFGWLGLAVTIYMIIIIANILQQSLLASKTKEILAWYIAPIGIVTAIWLTQKVTFNLLFG